MRLILVSSAKLCLVRCVIGAGVAVFATRLVGHLPLLCHTSTAVAGSHVEDEMLLKERQDLAVDTAVVTPGSVSACAVVLLRFVGNSEFVQLMRKGLVGVDVILIGIAAPPIKLEPPLGT